MIEDYEHIYLFELESVNPYSFQLTDVPEPLRSSYKNNVCTHGNQSTEKKVIISKKVKL